MNIIAERISDDLKDYLLEKLQFYENTFDPEMSCITSVVLTDRFNTTKHDDKLITLLKQNYKLKFMFDKYNLVNITIMHAPINSKPQFFHLDYNGTATSYFIPLTNLTELNGTEYIEFKNPYENIKFFDLFLEINNEVLSKNDIILKLKDNNLHNNVDYEFKILCCDAFSLVELPHYIFHRAQSNKTRFKKYIVAIEFSINENSFTYTPYKNYTDQELDEGPTVDATKKKKNIYNVNDI